MQLELASPLRLLKEVQLNVDLAVIGGGMAGVCCAITAARQGISVVLIQDRPVLGGNASSEVRLWILGATSHMGNNNRWAREGGVIDELLVENVYRNPEGNTIIFDTIMIEKVTEEPNITLLLNTSVYETIKSDSNHIREVIGFCSQNSTSYRVSADLFCDASGDGIVGFQAGAAFRMGAESAAEFNEPFAPTEEYGELLGHSMYFMSKDLGKPVDFVPPSYALMDITKIPRFRKFNVEEHGCWLWWLEYGGRLDTIHESETIKWELWKVVYGVWNYIKNSGNFPEARNMTLEWVGNIPGKRESRRFEGLYMLKQLDVVQQTHFYDAVAHGGWAIDLHPADGVFSEKPGCNQWHSKGVYSIPYRTMVSRNIENLFLAGRLISASHVAFGSTRVMATCAHNAQAVGVAAALVKNQNLTPAALADEKNIHLLQNELLKIGQFIPHLKLDDDLDLIQSAKIEASSILSLKELPFDGPMFSLIYGAAQLLPVAAGKSPTVEIECSCGHDCDLEVSIRRSLKVYNYTPDHILGSKIYSLKKGVQHLEIDLDINFSEPAYAFICFHKQPQCALRMSQTRVTGIVSVFNKQNIPVSNYGKQEPDPATGFESFEFWVPIRRPEGHNIAMRIRPGLDAFSSNQIRNGLFRPYIHTNAWVAAFDDGKPSITVEWPDIQKLRKFVLSFDTDWDYAMESSLLGHAERVMPFVVRNYQVFDDQGNLLIEKKDNYQTRNEIILENTIKTKHLKFVFERTDSHVPVGLFGISIYNDI
ncbi:MAG: FAD-dependent oxidoreductase [Saprospiraceae bacterium]|nr:FAD-dependent oxidoreductase [Saprospiraceae bacterium]